MMWTRMATMMFMLMMTMTIMMVMVTMMMIMMMMMMLHLSGATSGAPERNWSRGIVRSVIQQ